MIDRSINIPAHIYILRWAGELNCINHYLLQLPPS